MANKAEGMLSPYRALDLTDEKGLICGKILGDLGADVIKIEKPGGDAARSIGPFYHDEPDPERSLFWFALNTSKRGITLDVTTADGQDIFKRLVKTADFVIESYAPGYMDKIGLGFAELQKIKPGIILVSISAFGQTGPWRDYKSYDIVAMALSGEMAGWGEPDRQPVRISNHSQSYLNAGADGAIGALMALYQRNSNGVGEHIDISIQDAVSLLDGENRNPAFSRARQMRPRGSSGMVGAGHKTKRIWPCKDGYVSWSHGGLSPLGPSLPLVKWMEKEGFTNEYMKTFDWNRPDFGRVPQEEFDQIEEATGRFFMAHTKAELMEGAVKNDAMLYPVSTTEDMLENRQLTARNFWVEIEHPELGVSIKYPGAFGAFSEMPMSMTMRAPLIGEHNQEIYAKEMGISKETLLILKQGGII